MGTRGEAAIWFRPRSVADTFDGQVATPGTCQTLTDLIWDPSTPAALICRPANTSLIDFTAWSAAVPNGAAGVVTTAYQVGNIVLGLIGITSGTFSGLDYPFAYNTVTSAFLVVSGVTTVKCPASQATAGAWVPPQMSLTGIDLIVTHVGFDGTTHFFGYFDVTTPTAPTWNSGNTSTNGLPSVPQACGSFNNRTYFFCGNVAYYTDTLAIKMTNANQSLTIDDYTNVTAVAPLPVSNTSQAIVQGLLAFKSNKIYLITGDVTTSNLGSNQLSTSVGTMAPRSVVPTPQGVWFMANDGIRKINFLGMVEGPDEDLAMPFIYAVQPSRVCAAFNENIYRICVQNGNAIGSPYQDYWYDLRRKGWTGPHSFRYDVIVPLGTNFALASNSITQTMWNSYAVQGAAGGSSFIENGTQLLFNYLTTPMIDLENLYANSANRCTMDIAAPASGQTYNFTAQNESGGTLAIASITEPNSQAIWGNFNWGASNWGAANTGLIPITIPWNQAVVFNRLALQVAGQSALEVKLGGFNVGYKRLNYFLN